MTPQSDMAFAWLTQPDVRIHELGHVLERGMPVSPNHPPFQSALVRRHGDVVRPDGGSAANDLLVMGTHVGTHLDGLAHVSHEGLLFGDHRTTDVESDQGFSVLGMETLAPILCRGLLLDVAQVHGVDALAPGYEVTVDDLRAACDAAGTEVRPGDAILIRSGWASHWRDPGRYLGQIDGAPGPGAAAAQWLAARAPRLVGGETVALEVIHPGLGHRTLPVHRVLLVEHGIHILEAMDLGTLAADRAWTSVFVCLPLRIRGATASPVRPIAIAQRPDGTP